jgi:hypothetical protein
MKCCPAGSTCASGNCYRATPEQPGFGPGYATPCSNGLCRPCSCYTQCPPGQACSTIGAPQGSGTCCVPCYRPCQIDDDCGSPGDICVNGCCHSD